jgi:YegS/Rv2252/BmrU family lipid kinase
VTPIVLLNAATGRMSGDMADAIRRRFASHGVEADVRLVEHDHDVGEAAARAVADGPPVIVAGGGDGTLNAVAQAVVGHDIAFGVLPFGTLNHFAKDAGIPLDLDAAVATICNGDVVNVDVGRVNGRLFLNNSSLGMYAQVVKRREALTERMGHTKWPSFIRAALNVLLRFPFLDIRITIDGATTSYHAPVVFVGNNRYELSGMAIGERRRLDAGYLSVEIVSAATRAELIALACRALLGRPGEATNLTSLMTTGVVVQTRRSHLSVAIDGEVHRMQVPLVYRVEPRALRVIVPARGG